MGKCIVEVAYVSAQHDSFLVALSVPDGSSAMQVVELSGFFQQYPEWRDTPLALGIFSRPVDSAYLVQSGDRVEIYRPLQLSPMDARKLRAAKRALIR